MCWTSGCLWLPGPYLHPVQLSGFLEKKNQNKTFSLPTSHVVCLFFTEGPVGSFPSFSNIKGTRLHLLLIFEVAVWYWEFGRLNWVTGSRALNGGVKGGKTSWHRRGRELPLHNIAHGADLLLYYMYACVYPPCCWVTRMGYAWENTAFRETWASGILVRYLELVGQIWAVLPNVVSVFWGYRTALLSPSARDLVDFYSS